MTGLSSAIRALSRKPRDSVVSGLPVSAHSCASCDRAASLCSIIMDSLADARRAEPRSIMVDFMGDSGAPERRSIVDRHNEEREAL